MVVSMVKSTEILGINQRNLGYIYPSNPRKYFPVADDKALTKKKLSQFNIPVAPTYYLISTMGEINSLWDKICQLSEFAIKPSKGRAGGGILVLKRQDKSWISPSGKIYGNREVRKHMADIIFGVYSFGLWDKVMIEYRIYSHQVFLDIFPIGVADIRIIVYNNIPIMSMVRIPTEKSGGKANLHQGAIGVGVDLNIGLMKDGFDGLSYFSKHPDTDVKFKGNRLPFWKEILDMTKKTSYAVPLNYLGVDIVIDREKGPLIMEVNARPGLEIQNVNRSGLREILERHEGTRIKGEMEG